MGLGKTPEAFAQTQVGAHAVEFFRQWVKIADSSVGVKKKFCNTLIQGWGTCGWNL